MRPPPSLTAAVDALSRRQRQCLTLASEGLTSSRIAMELGLSPRTVDEHLAGACRLLGVRTRIQAVARFAAASPSRPGPTVDLRRGSGGSMLYPRGS